jgi:hypothetical protein
VLTAGGSLNSVEVAAVSEMPDECLDHSDKNSGVALLRGVCDDEVVSVSNAVDVGGEGGSKRRRVELRSKLREKQLLSQPDLCVVDVANRFAVLQGLEDEGGGGTAEAADWGASEAFMDSVDSLDLGSQEVFWSGGEGGE